MRVVPDFSDLSCRALLQANNARGFDVLFDTYSPSLCRFAHGYLKNQADAEEIVQGCFLKVWELRHTFDAGIVFKTYLYTAAYHAILKQLRRQRYWVFEDCHEQTLIEEATPADSLEQQELEQLYQEALAQLPPGRRQVFTLSRQQGLSYAAIAQELNVSVKNVENQMTQALKFLKLYFQTHGVSLALALLLLAR